jgi:hypothetical protein
MIDDLLTIDHLIILLVILILGVSMSVLKREPEPFKNMIESGRTFYNKHHRLVRTTLRDTTNTLTDRVKTRMRLAGF